MTQLQINEVAPRDGFQIEATFVPTADKIRLIDALSATGLARIEATSFVSPKAIPNLRDAAEVVSGIQRRDDVGITVLVLASARKIARLRRATFLVNSPFPSDEPIHLQGVQTFKKPSSLFGCPYSQASFRSSDSLSVLHPS